MFRSLLGFDIDFWDYVTFVTILLLVVAGVVVYCWLAGLPGRIAIARKHPDAEAVKLLGGLACFRRSTRGSRRSSGPSSRRTKWTSGVFRARSSEPSKKRSLA